MSGVQRISGNLPDPHRMIREIDERAKRAAAEAARDGLAVVHAEAPGSFSRDSVKSRVSKTPTGYEIVIQPVRRKRNLARLVSGGTGIHGPKKRPIRRKAPDGRVLPMRIRGRVVSSSDGQKANPFFARARDRATDAAARAITRIGTGR